MAKKYVRIVYKRAYRCARCRAWHISSAPPGRRPRIKR